VIAGKPGRSTSDTFCLEWREKRKRSMHTITRSAPHRAKSSTLGGSDQELTLAKSKRWGRNCQRGLLDNRYVPAEDLAGRSAGYQGRATWRAYGSDLAWFEALCRKHYVNQFGRSDPMALFVTRRNASTTARSQKGRARMMRLTSGAAFLRSQGPARVG
jgi:hypothetical protein